MKNLIKSIANMANNDTLSLVSLHTSIQQPNWGQLEKSQVYFLHDITNKASSSR